jgi:molecular chaperone GrpE
MPSSPGSDAQEQAVEERSPEQECEELRRRNAELEDRYKRALADLDNYRKRADREIERRVAERAEGFMRGWLDAVDSVERALRATAPDDPAVEGLAAILEQMEGNLARHGVNRIEAEGQRFDPERHEAIGTRETGDVPSGTVVDVARPGFTIGDRVLRPSQVIVSRSPQRED